MNKEHPYQVFFSYSEENRNFVETLARRLRSEARIHFWFAPWHSIPGVPFQEQMEEALQKADACAVFVGPESRIGGWQNEQIRVAIQRRVEDDRSYRVIPVLVPGTPRPKASSMPPFLRLYVPVEFHDTDDNVAFKRLLAGILGLPPIDIDEHIQASTRQEQLPAPSSGMFMHGQALVIGVAHYLQVRPLPGAVLNDAHDFGDLLIDPHMCGYVPTQVIRLVDSQATGAGIRAALANLSAQSTEDDTAIVFFSGHGAHTPTKNGEQQYILPYDCDPTCLSGTAISGDEMTAMLDKIRAGRLLLLLDSCHSGGVGDPKGAFPELKAGLSETYYQALAQGKGRVVIASSRTDEVSWALPDMRNSLFTHYLLDALRGHCPTLGDGYVRVFDVFRHLADRIPKRATQHPVFKAAAMEKDFPVALAPGNQPIR